MRLTDNDICVDTITSLKTLAKLYLGGSLESNCSKMRKVVDSNLKTLQAMQFNLFEYMNKNNMYPIKHANPIEVTQAVNKFSNK
ncbi:MAG: spore coat protein [Firmicutes bacterium]|nr:spore coat protein [Bacillota bacterium]